MIPGPKSSLKHNESTDTHCASPREPNERTGCLGSARATAGLIILLPRLLLLLLRGALITGIPPGCLLWILNALHPRALSRYWLDYWGLLRRLDLKYAARCPEIMRFNVRFNARGLVWILIFGEGSEFENGSWLVILIFESVKIEYRKWKFCGRELDFISK